MTRTSATFIGDVQSVSGSTVSVRLNAQVASLLLVEGTSYRVGQVGSFLRIPLGYTDLYGVCTQVGAAAIPDSLAGDASIDSRWLTISLFGESIGGEFERGVAQYPTFGDAVHIVTDHELHQIYRSTRQSAPIEIGTIASASGIDARLDIAKLLARHSAVVGSSGSGKSNLVATILNSISTQGFPSARVIVLDPHGEYSAAIGNNGHVFSVSPDDNEKPLHVPFWALPFDELMQITLGELGASNDSVVRAEVEHLKAQSKPGAEDRPSYGRISADSPVPFSIEQLWFDLIDFENRTYTTNAHDVASERRVVGDAHQLIAPEYDPPAAGNVAPFKGPKRGLTRSLELMKNRLSDSRYDFLFKPGPDFSPSLSGDIELDLDELVKSWVGHERPVTVMDLSGAPEDVLSVVTGTVLRIIYDALFWGSDTGTGGKKRPLLVVLEEAHLVLPEGGNTAAHRTIAKIAKEGRKYGIGLMLVTQRPTDLDSTALSQCGTMLALRLTNAADRARVSATMPDELGDLASMLPALRTGEAIMTGEAVPIPSRVRVREARGKTAGADPNLAAGWRRERQTLHEDYSRAIANWRNLSFAPQEE